MWGSKDIYDDSKFQTTQCPVCRAILGKRDKDIIFMAHCEECRATFTWRPGEDKPTGVMNKDIKKVRHYCDKNGCYCRS